MTETDIRKNKLYRLAKFVCEDLGVSFDRFYNQYARGEVATARHVFVLVATDSGFAYPEVASVLKRDPSFITQCRRRKQKLRNDIEYIHAKAFLDNINQKYEESVNAAHG